MATDNGRIPHQNIRVHYKKGMVVLMQLQQLNSQHQIVAGRSRSKFEASVMKFFVVVLALAMFVGVQALTDEQKEKLKEHYKVCSQESNVDKELVKKVRDGDFEVEDPHLNSMFLCMFKRIGIMDDAGNFHKEVALAKVDAGIRDDVSRAIDACLGHKGATPAETAFKYAKCYHKERPTHDVV